MAFLRRTKAGFFFDGLAALLWKWRNFKILYIYMNNIVKLKLN